MSSRSKRQRSRRRVVDSWKTKSWYDVYAPKSFKEAFLGQIPASDPSLIPGRTIEVLLYDITNDFRHTHIKLRFKIIDVKGKNCYTRFIGHELTFDFIRSLVHRGTTRIDGIFNFKTADGFVFRVSCFCVTVRRAKGSQKKAIRKIMYQVLNEFAKSSNHGKFIRGMIYGKFAENIAKIAKTIYPLRECQIRKSKLISFPEGVEDEDYDENEVFEEKIVKLKPHGKQIKSKKNKRRSQQKSQQTSSESKKKTEESQQSGEEKTEEKESETGTEPSGKEEAVIKEQSAVESVGEGETAPDSVKTEEISEKEKKKKEKEAKKAAKEAEKKAKKEKKEKEKKEKDKDKKKK